SVHGWYLPDFKPVDLPNPDGAYSTTFATASSSRVGGAERSVRSTCTHTWSAPRRRCSTTRDLIAPASPQATIASTSLSLPPFARSASLQPSRRRFLV